MAPLGAYYALFLLSLFLMSWLCGTWVLWRPGCLPAPRLTRFLLGFCMGPFLIASLVFVIAGVMPGAPRGVHLLLPLALSMAGLVLLRRSPIRVLVADARRRWRSNPHKEITVLIYLCSIPLIASASGVMWSNAQSIVYSDDALKYLQEALAFAQDRSWASLPRFDGPLGGNTASSTHSPIYQMLLAFALLCTPAQELGFPNDEVVRCTVQVLLVYLALCVVALAQYVRHQGAGPAVLILLSMAEIHWPFFSYLHSRDAFRLIALVSFLIVFIPLSHRRCTWRHGVLLAITTMFGALSHSVDALAIMLVSAAFVLLKLRVGEIRSALLPGCWIGLGGLLGSVQTLHNKLTTGHLTGWVPRRGFEGTPLWETLLDSPRFSLIATYSPLERLDAVFRGQGQLITILQFAVALGIACVFVWRPVHGRNRVYAFAALGMLAMYVPVLGIMDGLQDLPISYLYTGNMRYMAQAHPLGALLLVTAMFWLLARADSKARPVAVAMCVASVIYCAVDGYRMLTKHASVLTAERQARTLEQIRSINEGLAGAPGVVVVDEDFIRYYIDVPSAYLGYVQLWPLLRVTEEAQLLEIVSRLGVSHFVFSKRKILSLWGAIPLRDILDSSTAVSSRELFPGFFLYTVGAGPGTGGQ